MWLVIIVKIYVIVMTLMGGAHGRWPCGSEVQRVLSVSDVTRHAHWRIRPIVARWRYKKRGIYLRRHLRTGGDRDAARRRGVRLLAVAVVVRRRPPRAAVHLHVLPEAGGVGVGLVATRYPTVVGLVGGVDVRVFLSVRRVGESPVTAFVLALEGFFSWNNNAIVY